MKNNVRKKRKRTRKLSTITARVTMFIYAIVIIYPMFWTAITSLKTSKEFYANPWALPKVPQWSNYTRAWLEANVSDYFMNSIIVTVFALILSILLSATTAYILARFSFRGSGFITSLYIAGLSVPGVLVIIPTFFLLDTFHLMDSLIGLCLLYVARTIPFSLLVLLGFFKTLPKELEESAAIDGCSMSRTFWNIMFPLAKPGIVTVIIFNFLWYWNEYVFALTYITSPLKRTLPVGITTLMEVAQYRTDWGALFAGLMIVMVPTLVIYLIFQNKISDGLTAGAVKG